MIRQKKRILSALCILACSAALAQEPSDPCKWTDRGDRWEGVLDRQPVSGGSFELVSVHYQRPPEAAAESDQLHLLFWLPEQEELDEIEVWQPARLYRMEPARKQYGEGRQSFT